MISSLRVHEWVTTKEDHRHPEIASTARLAQLVNAPAHVYKVFGTDRLENGLCGFVEILWPMMSAVISCHQETLLE
jgi:hypothetical protein